MAPPTNPAADQSDDVVSRRGPDGEVPAEAPPAGASRSGKSTSGRSTSGKSTSGKSSPGAEHGAGPADPHEVWILQQRPPHWG